MSNKNLLLLSKVTEAETAFVVAAALVTETNAVKAEMADEILMMSVYESCVSNASSTRVFGPYKTLPPTALYHLQSF